MLLCELVLHKDKNQIYLKKTLNFWTIGFDYLIFFIEIIREFIIKSKSDVDL